MNNISSLHEFIGVAGTIGDTGKDAMRALQQYQQRRSINWGGAPLVYLMDYTQLKYYFITPHQTKLLGYPVQQFERGGLEFTFDIYHPGDLKLYSKEIFTRNYDFLRTTPIEQRPDYIFTHSFRLKNKKGGYTTLLQHYTVIESSPQGIPLLFLCYATDISNWHDNSKILHKIDRAVNDSGITRRERIFEKIIKAEPLLPRLSQREIEIVRLIANEYSSVAISQRLHISIHTVNNHRKNIMTKTGCRSQGDLIRFAIDSLII